MTLVDTSDPVEFDRNTGSDVDVRLTQLIADDGPPARDRAGDHGSLAGARTDARERDPRPLLLRFRLRPAAH